MQLTVAVALFPRSKSHKHLFHWFHVNYINFSAFRCVPNPFRDALENACYGNLDKIFEKYLWSNSYFSKFSGSLSTTSWKRAPFKLFFKVFTWLFFLFLFHILTSIAFNNCMRVITANIDFGVRLTHAKHFALNKACILQYCGICH